MGENLADVLNSIEVEDEEVATDEEEFIDPEQAVVTKVKRWVALVCAANGNCLFCHANS